MKKMFGITKIHNPSGSVTFWVRIGYGCANCPYIRKSFTSTVYGGINKAKNAALQYRDDIFDEWGIDLEKPLSRPRSPSKSKFGVPGITIREASNKESHSPLFYLVVLYCTKESKHKATPFEEKKYRIYPDEPNQCWAQFKLAYEFRLKMELEHYRNYPVLKHKRPLKRDVLIVIKQYASKFHYG